MSTDSIGKKVMTWNELSDRDKDDFIERLSAQKGFIVIATDEEQRKFLESIAWHMGCTIQEAIMRTVGDEYSWLKKEVIP
jgi:hypothetical protein